MTATTGVRVRARDTALVAYLFTVVMAGTTLPTPIYAVYSQRLSLSPLMITVIYAVYSVGVLGTLQLLGRLSDHVGRRPVLLAAVGFSALSAVIYLTDSSLPGLFAGRIVSGVSAGLVTGGVTAYVTELESARPGPSRAALISTVANMGGLGLGPLVAGVLAEHLAHPTITPFVASVILLGPAVLVLPAGVPETVRERDGWRNGVRPQPITVPEQIRTGFAAAALAGLAAFSLLGFVTALAGQLLAEGLGDRSHQTAGLASSSMFAAATVAQVIAGRVPARRGALLGLTVLPLGCVAMIVAVATSSMPALFTGTLVGGLGVGFAFRAGLSRVTQLAPADQRGAVISTFFLAVYVGLIVPVIVAGVLVTSTTLLTATVALTVFVVVVAAGSFAIVVRTT